MGCRHGRAAVLVGLLLGWAACAAWALPVAAPLWGRTDSQAAQLVATGAHRAGRAGLTSGHALPSLTAGRLGTAGPGWPAAAARRAARVLLQQAPEHTGAPVCEVDMMYRVLDVSDTNSTGVFTIVNNREVRPHAGCGLMQVAAVPSALWVAGAPHSRPTHFTCACSPLQVSMGHWQVVYRYADFRRVRLRATDGAIVLTYGSDRGAPVRLVDSFSSDGVEGGASCINMHACA